GRRAAKAAAQNTQAAKAAAEGQAAVEDTVNKVNAETRKAMSLFGGVGDELLQDNLRLYRTRTNFGMKGSVADQRKWAALEAEVALRQQYGSGLLGLGQMQNGKAGHKTVAERLAEA